MVVRADAGVAPAHILPLFCVWLLQAGEGHQELLRFRVTNSSVMVVCCCWCRLWNKVNFQGYKLDFSDGAMTDNYAIAPLIRRKVGWLWVGMLVGDSARRALAALPQESSGPPRPPQACTMCRPQNSCQHGASAGPGHCVAWLRQWPCISCPPKLVFHAAPHMG